MAEARRHFEALEYEQTVPALDRVVAALQSRQGDAGRELLAEALELRARSRFGLADADGAKQDFTALLKANPAYALNAQVSPRVVALFDESDGSADSAVLLDDLRWDCDAVSRP